MRILSLLFGCLMLFSTGAFAKPEYSVVRDYVVPVFTAIKMTEGKNAGKFVAIAGGSAVVIAKGYAVSAYHVFSITEQLTETRETKYAAQRRNSKNTFSVEIVTKNEKNDVVLLKGDFKCPCAPLATKLPEIDDPVYAVGYPKYIYWGLQVLTAGRYQGMSNVGPAATTHGTGGASGGGLFVKQDGKYRLYGIIDAIGETSIGPRALKVEQQLNWMMFAISIEKVRKLLAFTEAATLVQ